ncbi:UNVERIFIED_CONTAM: hypothetical protein Sradi_2374400 [Sesamum radiatum]|uniref:Uncharacterized protein n=1 Tax=Sesamum radiatum TaxID=300843 RepID=A0AAW2T616_SESRA
MAERFGVTCKVAPRAAGYQGQHLSYEWVIEASTLRPRNSTHGTRYRVQAVHKGPLVKTSGRGTTPHYGQILRPCRKARRNAGRAVWDHCKMLACRIGHGLKMRYSSEAHRTATMKTWANDAPSERWT